MRNRCAPRDPNNIAHCDEKSPKMMLVKPVPPLGELLPSLSNQLPLFPAFASGLLSIVVAVLILQSDQSRDDDDSGPGDGGLMQPVGAGA